MSNKITTEEAIKRVEKWKFINKDGCEDNGFKELVVEALEKQIPKHPIKVDPKLKQCDSWDWICPTCGLGGGLVDFYENTDKYDYCNNCGQRLDWSDVE